MSRPSFLEKGTILGDAWDWFGEHTKIPESWFKTLFFFAWGNSDGPKPDWSSVITKTPDPDIALLYNAPIFIRLGFPFFGSLYVKYTQTKLFTFMFGWKANGYLTVTLRFQTDQSSAEGMDGPNSGQMGGFKFGPH